jgi:hypothetical protein
MSWDLVLAHTFLPGAVAAAAGLGAWRCWRLLRYAPDPRLWKLLGFYALFAASLVAYALWIGQVAAEVGASLGATQANVTAPLGDLHGAFAGAHRLDPLLLAHHALMLASLAVAVQAFRHPRAAGAAVAGVAGLASLEPFIPVLLALEAAMTLYLAVQAVLNHMERRTAGALQVAAGFLLFFLGHLTFFLLYHPGGPRTLLGDVLALVGIALLVQLLPRPSA